MQEDGVRIIDNPVEPPKSENEDCKLQLLPRVDPLPEVKKNAKENIPKGPKQAYQSYPTERESGYEVPEHKKDQTLRDAKMKSWLNVKMVNQIPERVIKTTPKVTGAFEEIKQVPGGKSRTSLNEGSQLEKDVLPRKDDETMWKRNEVEPQRSSNPEPDDQPNQTLQMWKRNEAMLQRSSNPGLDDHPNQNLQMWKMNEVVLQRSSNPEFDDQPNQTVQMWKRNEVVLQQSSNPELDDQPNQTLQDRWGLLDGDESAVRGIPRDNLRWRIGDGAANVFHPENDQSCEPAIEYFLNMWLPRFFDLLDISSNVILMCWLSSGAARTIQGCFLFFPYVVLWGSKHNTSQFEAWYIQSQSKEKVDMPMKALVNTLPYTGIPTVCLLEWYGLVYMVCWFPIIFWRHQAQSQQRPFQLSRDIFDHNRNWYIRMLRLVFENLPTTVLLLAVLTWSQDHMGMVVFSLLTSVISVAWTLSVLVSTAFSRDQPLHIVIISSLLIPPNFTLLPKNYGITPRRGG